MKIYLVLFVMIVLSACSNKAIYDNAQRNNRNACAKLPPADYDECIKRASKSYEQYEQERREALEK